MLTKLPQLRAIVIVDDVPRSAQALEAHRRLLARPFTAQALLAEIALLLGWCGALHSRQLTSTSDFR